METYKYMGTLIILLVIYQLKLSFSQECVDRVTARNPLRAMIRGVKPGPSGSFRRTIRNVTVNSCTDLFNKYPALCQSTNIGADGGSCCETCGDHNCLDKITKQYPFYASKGPRGPTKAIYSCEALVNKYPVLCREQGSPRGQCCRACKGAQDLECLDDFREPPSAQRQHDIFETCSRYVKADPCRCATPDVKSGCCLSCRNIDLLAQSCNCTDIFNPKLRGLRLFVTIQYGRNLTLIDRQALKSCRDMANWFPSYCARHGQENGECCKTCRGVDTTCVDNLYWRANVTLDDGTTCNDCTCHDIRRQGRPLMRQACQYNTMGNNLPMGARVACCNQCARLGFRKPYGYEADRRIRYSMSAIL